MMKLKRKGPTFVAVSVFLFFVLVPIPHGREDEAKATATVVVPTFEFHPKRDEAFELFREIRVFGEYSPHDEATTFMEWDEEVRREFVEARVRAFAGERYGKQAASKVELQATLVSLWAEAPVFAQSEMHYASDTKPLSLEAAHARLSAHISLHFLHEMCYRAVRDPHKPPPEPMKGVMATRG